jgi:hypothetical protein
MSQSTRNENSLSIQSVWVVLKNHLCHERGDTMNHEYKILSFVYTFMIYFLESKKHSCNYGVSFSLCLGPQTKALRPKTSVYILRKLHIVKPTQIKYNNNSSRSIPVFPLPYIKGLRHYIHILRCASHIIAFYVLYTYRTVLIAFVIKH